MDDMDPETKAVWYEAYKSGVAVGQAQLVAALMDVIERHTGYRLVRSTDDAVTDEREDD